MDQTSKIVFKDYYRDLFKWLLFLVILSIVVRVVTYLINYFVEEASELGHFLDFTLDPMTIGLLILGIIAIYGFLPQVIKLGGTRKSFFIGMVYTVLALILSYTLVNLSLTFIEYTVMQTSNINSIALADVWYYVISLFLSFLAGIFIALGFYRYHWVIGLLFILVLLISKVFADFISHLISDILTGAKFDFLLSSLGDYTLIALGLWLSYKMIKDVPIKM
ncbi:hypothetical protein ACTWQB_07330 [Piscibacillus sp. B03]|uniref:hypothetical protein n=1 Tax=Piscibacillus sp. B03 TaxID=3457430 RepID=UPI003FCEB0DF